MPRAEGRVPRHEPLFRQMAVVGLGLIGGSLALAARAAKAVETVLGVDRDPAHRAAALRLGIADRVAESLEPLADADLVVLAVPVAAIQSLLPAVAVAVTRDALVTDVGSVKRPVVAAGDAVLPDGRFVAGHPIAGRERSGPDAAHAELFAGATWIATPSARTQAGALARVSALWRAAGAICTCMDAGWHDEVFAAVSHLPHLVAYALMDAVLGMDRGEERLGFSAGGLRDFTRVAASSPEMWRDIFLTNREPILRVLAAYREAVGQLEGAIRDRDGEALMRQLQRAWTAREAISHATA